MAFFDILGKVMQAGGSIANLIPGGQVVGIPLSAVGGGVSGASSGGVGGAFKGAATGAVGSLIPGGGMMQSLSDLLKGAPATGPMTSISSQGSPMTIPAKAGGS